MNAYKDLVAPDNMRLLLVGFIGPGDTVQDAPGAIKRASGDAVGAVLELEWTNAWMKNSKDITWAMTYQLQPVGVWTVIPTGWSSTECDTQIHGYLLGVKTVDWGTVAKEALLWDKTNP